MSSLYGNNMPPRSQQLGFLAAVVGMFMAILDIQIVSSSLIQIQAGVSASRDEISWVQTAYLIAEIVMIPLSGTLARIFSTRIAYVVSCLGFTLASVGCALSSSLETLVFMRILQGFFGGAMIPLTQAVSFKLFPRSRMGSVQAVIGLVATLAPSIGPTLGGYITDHLSWHWLFLINVLPGIVVSLSIWNLLDIDQGNRRWISNLDVPGILLMTVFLGSLEFVLEQGHEDDWFSSTLIFRMSIVSGIAGILFFWRSLTVEHPVLDLRLFRRRNFSLGIAVIFALGISLYGVVYLMPLFFGSIRGFSSRQIGEVMYVTGVSMLITAPILGRVGNYVSNRTLIIFGLAMIMVGSWMNTNLTAQSGFDEFLWPQIVRGVGFMACIIPASRVTIGDLPFNKIGEGAGMFSLMRNMGGAFGLAMIDTLLEMRDHYHWDRLIPSINEGRASVVDTLVKYQHMFSGTSADPYASAVQMIGRRVALQAEVLAYNDLFSYLALLYLFVLPVAFLIRKSPRA